MTDGCIKFDKMFHPEFDGWLWKDGEGVWISMIISKEEGKGNFKKLLDELKSKYKWIKIPTPSNRMLIIADKAGFKGKVEYCKEAGEDMNVLLWEKRGVL